MSENQLKLEKRTVTGKKVKNLRSSGLIPSVIYGGKIENILTQSPYLETEKALGVVGYHSPITLLIGDKKQLAMVKAVTFDPVTRRITSIDFHAVSATEAVEATSPIVIINFETSEANKKHFALLQVLEDIVVKAKPADLPKELTIDATHLTELDDKITIADITLPSGVEFADKELDPTTVIASLYDPAAEAAAREAELAAAEAAAAEEVEVTEETEATPAEGADEAQPAEESAENTEA